MTSLHVNCEWMITLSTRRCPSGGALWSSGEEPWQTSRDTRGSALATCPLLGGTANDQSTPQPIRSRLTISIRQRSPCFNYPHGWRTLCRRHGDACPIRRLGSPDERLRFMVFRSWRRVGRNRFWWGHRGSSPSANQGFSQRRASRLEPMGKSLGWTRPLETPLIALICPVTEESVYVRACVLSLQVHLWF